ncbi:MAG: hypothetical protein NTW95_14095 [Candidatus Aminicenantes bacterium]|nr:hypothetical protein [Candidatus Aminicenantes bacterium]
MEVYYQRLGGLQQKIVSDIKIPLLETEKFSQYYCRKENFRAIFYFFLLDQNSHHISRLTKLEKEALSKSIGFPKRWLESKALCFPQIREVIQNCLIFPELSFIDLSWKRILIQNFNTNEFYVFYPLEKEKTFSDIAFLAGFRNLIWGSFPKYSSMLMHGASVIIKKKAALFLAPDEGGKTTTISQFNKENILNDDQIVLKKNKKGIHIHATPFGTISCGNKSAPLGGIFLIHKSHFFRIKKANPQKILEFIWNEHMINSIIIPKKMRIDLFNLLYEVVKQTPVYNLYLKKGEVDQKTISQSLQI